MNARNDGRLATTSGEVVSLNAGRQSRRLRTAVEAVLGNVFTEGNRIEVLKNGDEIFPVMLQAIDDAEQSIDFVTFVYWTGDIARRFAHALAQKALEGVSVRVILDGFGSLPMDTALIDEMRKGGVVVERFRPIVRWKFWECDHRTHRKILVCDNRVAFTGGVGIAEEWMGDARNPTEWRETHFRIEGPAVLGLRAAFLTDWRDTDHPITAADIEIDVPGAVGATTLAVVDGSAQIGVNDAERVLEALFSAAQNRIAIQTPYFNPTEAIIDGIIDARRRGVDVDVLLPGPHIDKRISAVVAQDCYYPLIDEGVRVWVYQPTMMHVKAMLVDDEIAVIGSVNVNRRSVEKDEEVAVVVRDRDIGAELSAHFEQDIAASIPVSREDGPSIVERAVAVMSKPIRAEM